MRDGDTIMPNHLPDELLQPAATAMGDDLTRGNLPAAPALTPETAAPSDEEIAAALRNHTGSRKALATRLGISERTLSPADQGTGSGRGN